MPSTCAICGEENIQDMKHHLMSSSCKKAFNPSHKGYNILCNSCGDEIPRNIGDIISHGLVCDPEKTDSEHEDEEDERAKRARIRKERALLELNVQLMKKIVTSKVVIKKPTRVETEKPLRTKKLVTKKNNTDKVVLNWNISHIELSTERDLSYFACRYLVNRPPPLTTESIVSPPLNIRYVDVKSLPIKKRPILN